MKRTKFKTQQTKTKSHPIPSGRLGGHIPDPPENCQGRVVLCVEENRKYVDCTCCFDCTLKKTCERKKENEREWKEYRIRMKEEHK